MMATSYYPNSSPSHDEESSLHYVVAVLVSAAVVFLLLHTCGYCCHRLNKKAQEAEAAGLHHAPPSSGGGGGDTAVGPRQQQQPPAPAPAASSSLTVDMALRSAALVVCTYRKADGWAEVTYAVCLAELADGVSVRVLPVCMHYFHAACVGEWLLVHHTCPLCGAPLDPTAAVVVAPA